MPSAVLLQRTREAQEEARVVSASPRIDGISIVRSREGSRGAGRFSFEAEIVETGRSEDGMSVRYNFSFGTAYGQACTVRGTAEVRFSRFDPSTDFRYLGDDVANEIAVEIFRKDYEAVYLLHETMGAEAPSPWITQEVSLSARAAEA